MSTALIFNNKKRIMFKQFNLVLIMLLFAAISSFAQITNKHIPSKGIQQFTWIKKFKNVDYYQLRIQVNAYSTKENLSLKCHYYLKDSTRESPLIIVAPPIEGISGREKSLIQFYVQKGFNVLVVEPIKNVSNAKIAIKDFEANLLAFVSGIRSAIDVMSSRNETDSNNIILWGSSMGAIYSSLVMGIDDRIKAGVLIVAGSSIPNIVGETSQRYIKNYRDVRIKEEELSDEEEFTTVLKAVMKVDPKNEVSKINFPPTYFIVATKDKTVPYKYQQEMVNATNAKAVVVSYRGNHAFTLVKSHKFKQKEIYQFVKTKLTKN